MHMTVHACVCGFVWIYQHAHVGMFRAMHTYMV